MATHNILPLCVPAGCTDYMHECSLVINAPFKKAVREAFCDYLHREFHQFATAHPERSDEWVPNLNAGHLKSFMTGWIVHGVNALKTPAMKDAIKKAFAKDGCLGAIRNRARQNSLVAGTYEEDMSSLLSGMELDEAVQELAADSGLVTEDFDDAAFEREEAAEDAAEDAAEAERLVLRLRLPPRATTTEV